MPDFIVGSSDETEDREPRWPGDGAAAAGQTRLPHYPGEGPEPLLPPGAAVTKDAGEVLPFDLDELFERLVKKWKLARDHSKEWRDEAREVYDFVAGKQWSDKDASVLAEQNRPVITFNRTGPMVKIVCGLESGNRQEATFMPRDFGDARVNEIYTEAIRWFRDECDAEDEESDAFWDLAVSGMGWIGTELDYDEDPEGRVQIEKIDPIEMYWDASARKKNLSDACVLFRLKEVADEDARRLYPNADENDLHAGWASDTAGTGAPHNADEAPFYRPNNRQPAGSSEGKVKLVEAQWWEYTIQWKIVDPLTGEKTVLSDAEMMVLRERLPMMGLSIPSAVRQRVRVYWRAMLGAKILDIWPGPAEGGFTWKAMTGERDRNKGTWYGIVRAMLDPQRWANKWLSQSMHIMNSGAKGGIMAESGAFPDIRRAEEDWADPTAIVEVENGALQAGKIMPRPVTPMPQGLPDLLTLALSSIRDCTGINLELLGLVERDQPGIVERQRKQAGMTVLSSMFNSLKRYRRNQSKLMLWYVRNFLSDGRLIRITGGISQQTAMFYLANNVPQEHVSRMMAVGSETQQYIPLFRDKDSATYDVVIDEAPTSPNMKEMAWVALMQMMPFLSRMDIPAAVYLELMKYSPLPESVTTKIAQIIQSMPPRPDPITIAAEGQAEMNKAKARLTDAQAQSESAKAQLGLIEAALKAKDTEARIENQRSASLVNIAKAGATQRGAATSEMLSVVDMLDTLTGIGQQARQSPAAG